MNWETIKIDSFSSKLNLQKKIILLLNQQVLENT